MGGSLICFSKDSLIDPHNPIMYKDIQLAFRSVHLKAVPSTLSMGYLGGQPSFYPSSSGETDWKILAIDVNDARAKDLNGRLHLGEVEGITRVLLVIADIEDVQRVMPGFLEVSTWGGGRALVCCEATGLPILDFGGMLQVFIVTDR